MHATTLESTAMLLLLAMMIAGLLRASLARGVGEGFNLPRLVGMRFHFHSVCRLADVAFSSRLSTIAPRSVGDFHATFSRANVITMGCCHIFVLCKISVYHHKPCGDVFTDNA